MENMPKKETRSINLADLRMFARILGAEFQGYEALIRDKKAVPKVVLGSDGKPEVFQIWDDKGEMIYMADLKFADKFDLDKLLGS